MKPAAADTGTAHKLNVAEKVCLEHFFKSKERRVITIPLGGAIMEKAVSCTLPDESCSGIACGTEPLPKMLGRFNQQKVVLLGSRPKSFSAVKEKICTLNCTHQWMGGQYRSCGMTVTCSRLPPSANWAHLNPLPFLDTLPHREQVIIIIAF